MSRETVQARGIFGQLIVIDPHHELVVVKLSTQTLPVQLQQSRDTLAAIRAVASELAGQS